MNRGLIGFAIWDHGDIGQTAQRGFYKRDLEYKLDHWGDRNLRAVEFQPEARFHGRTGETWYDLDLMSVDGFPRFIMNNRFLSYHLRSLGVDIADAYDPGHRDYGLGETIGSMRFAFSLNPDTITLHPGTGWSGDWPSNIHEARSVMDDRAAALKQGLWHVVNVFVEEAEALERLIEKHKDRPEVKDMIRLYKERREKTDDKTYYDNSSGIVDIIAQENIPVQIVRFARNPEKGLHLCIENIEPGNFMINTPGQHIYWLNVLREMFCESFNRNAFLRERVSPEKYLPMMLVDSNHYRNSQEILRQPGNAFLGELYPDAHYFWTRDYVELPGFYDETDEPIMNWLMRTHEDDIAYFHLAGCNRHGNSFSTHDPVKPIRYHMEMQRHEGGYFYPMYDRNVFVPDEELDLGNVIQIAGLDQHFILEVFNVASEVMESSSTHANGFVKHLEDERLHATKRILDRLHGSEKDIEDFMRRLEKARFYIRPINPESSTFCESGFYEWSDEPPFYDIFATYRFRSKEVWVNP